MMSRNCACKGIRTCLICEPTIKNSATDVSDKQDVERYIYCDICKKAYLLIEESQNVHPFHHGQSINFEGITILQDFITEEEEMAVCSMMNQTAWVDSQSGRRKQDYGPKVNFKKKKIKIDGFHGLPAYSQFIVDKIQSIDNKDFIPVELCNLEYCMERGSAIDPHFDDFWVWGERLITLNLLSSTWLSMTHDARPDIQVDIALPQRSLVIVSEAARHKWKHGIFRENIKARRIAMTFRELAEEFLPGGANEEQGQDLIAKAQVFS